MDEKINELLAEILRIKCENITDNLTMKDLDIWDSLKHMELIAAIEQELKIELSSDEIVSMQNVKEIKRILKTKNLY